MEERSYQRYQHTLTAAYRIRGVSENFLRSSFPAFSDVANLQPVQLMQTLLPTVKNRLSKVHPSLTATLLTEPRKRSLELLGAEVIVPIINAQGAEWYEKSPLANYDFVAEHALGLHDGAKVIYDMGGHHGIWAAYYAKVVGQGGRVYSFEPSIINIEVSSMLFLINGLDNIVNVAAAVGSSIKKSEQGGKMLVDFVQHDQLEVVNIRDVCWDRADFLKMDIEGFEYEIITENPWIFDLATHAHIEVHIPHLENRGLDYREIIKRIPFDRFEVFNHSADRPVYSDTPLSGFCSLMMRNRSKR